MDLTEWIISVALILVVVRQIRGRKLTLIGLLWPVPLVAWGAINYLGGVPAYAADWTFVAVDCAAGLALGVGCGLLTDVYIEDGVVKARARWLAAVLWIVGMSSRLAFGLFATNGGAEKIGELSRGINPQLAGCHEVATLLPVMRLRLHWLDVFCVEGCQGTGEAPGIVAEGGEVGAVCVLDGGVRTVHQADSGDCRGEGSRSSVGRMRESFDQALALQGAEHL